MKIIRIVITGGPCAGKTSVIKHLSEYLKQFNTEVLFVHETATELIKSGITSQSIGQLNFQKLLLKLQLKKEDIIATAANIQNKNVIIIHDRGSLDGKAYLKNNEFSKMLEATGISESELLSSYDAVFFLKSIASSDSEKYTTKNNTARSETPDEASVLDQRTFEVWKNHKNFYAIESFPDFDDKIKALESKLSVFLSSVIK